MSQKGNFKIAESRAPASFGSDDRPEYRRILQISLDAG